MTRQPYDFAVNLGVCGSFDPAFPIGTVVNVLTDCIAELGAEDGEAFITAEQLGLLGRSEFPFRGGLLLNSEPKGNRVVAKLPGATGITVNTVHGNDHSIARAVERFHPVVETMEGAAFMYACLVSGVRFAQVRAVSNMVEKRNRGAWKLAEAIEALNVVGLRVIEEA